LDLFENGAGATIQADVISTAESVARQGPVVAKVGAGTEDTNNLLCLNMVFVRIPYTSAYENTTREEAGTSETRKDRHH
jgi:hypothetical protein